MRPRGLCIVVGLALMTAAPAPSLAQGPWVLTPSFTVSEQFDDNIFATTSNRQSDFISQMTPGLSLAYESEPFTLLSSYSITGQIYAKNPDLNNFGDNQQGVLSGSYRPEPRLTLSLAGYYAKTNTLSTFLSQPTVPAGVTVVPTVGVGRREATQYTLNASAAYQFDPRLSGTGTYSFALLEQQGSATTTSNGGSLGISYQWTPRDQFSLTATGSVISGNGTNDTAGLLVGWSRQWTPDLSTSLAAGPQVTDGDWGGAATASLSYQLLRELSIQIAYSYGTSVAVGQTGAQTVSALTASLRYQPLRELAVDVSGGWTRSSPIGGVSSSAITNTYGANARGSYQLTDWLAAFLSYQFSLEEGGGTGSIPDNRVTLGVTLSYPIRF